jgi:hypothetical protein
VVQEAAHVFHRLAHIPPELGGGVAPDVDASGGRPARNGVRRAGRSMLLRPVKGPVWGGWGPIFMLDA